MRHEWDWSTAGYDTLPETLRDLEDQGWEIFAVCPIGGSEFCRIVYRRELRESEK